MQILIKVLQNVESFRYVFEYLIENMRSLVSIVYVTTNSVYSLVYVFVFQFTFPQPG